MSEKRTWILRSDGATQNVIDAVLEAREDTMRSCTPGMRPKLWRVILEPYQKPRSLEQNSTIHMWFGEIAEHVGDAPAAVKRWLKEDFYPRETVLRLGKFRDEPKSTSDLTAQEMTQVMEQIQALCAEYEIPITQPDPETKHGVRLSGRSAP